MDIIRLADGSMGLLTKDDQKVSFRSESYNFSFEKDNGTFIRWGKTLEDDGDLEIGLPEIADIEIAEVCDGVPGIGPCRFCYKNNVGFRGTNMTLDTFKKIFAKLPPTITQIAFGCGTLRKHPEMWDIFRYTKENGVVPNLTINGDVDEDELDKIAELCGACAVSVYDKELSYNAVKALTDRGMEQVNIHYMISEETYDTAFEVMDDIMTDDRLASLNAIVFLSLKLKGRSIANHYHQLSQEKFDDLMRYAMDNNISFGFDSCSAQKVFRYIDRKDPSKKSIKQYIEPCESTLYSMYVDVRGNFYPCSFIEGEDGWGNGISVLKVKDFINDVWFNEKTKKFRERVIGCRRKGKSCPVYKI